MGSYRTILVAVDGSREGRVALTHAAELARDQHARLVVVTVVPPVHSCNGVGAAMAVPDQEPAFARELHHALETVPSEVGVEARLARGPVADRILETARRCSCDLIVLGCHGHRRTRGLFKQPVRDAVIADGRWPVLLVGPGSASDSLDRSTSEGIAIELAAVLDR